MNESNSTGEDPWIKFSIDYRVAVTCLLVPVGTVGNVLTMVIMRRKTFAKNTHSLFLTCLAAIDICILYTCLLPDTVTQAMRAPHLARSEFACRANWYIMIVLTNISSWLLVVLSIERVISVWLPFRAKQLCTKRTAVVAVAVIAITLSAFNVVLVLYRFSMPEPGVCYSAHGFWAWVNSVVYSFGPGSIMIVCSTSVIVKLWILPSTAGKSRKISGNVIMMIALNLSFLATTSPVVILFATTDITDQLSAGDGRAFVVVSVVQMLFYANSGVNFFLYALSGPQFRREALNVFYNASRRRVAPSGNSAARSDNTPGSTVG